MTLTVNMREAVISWIEEHIGHDYDDLLTWTDDQLAARMEAAGFKWNEDLQDFVDGAGSFWRNM